MAQAMRKAPDDICRNPVGSTARPEGLSGDDFLHADACRRMSGGLFSHGRSVKVVRERLAWEGVSEGRVLHVEWRDPSAKFGKGACELLGSICFCYGEWGRLTVDVCRHRSRAA